MMSDLKTIIFHPHTAILFIAFFAVRILSYFVAPHFLIQNIVSTLLIILLAVLYFKKPEYAWYLVIAEIFLGGSGHFLELAGLSIRTLFFMVYIFLYTGHHLISKEKRKEILIPHKLYILCGGVALAILWAAVNGMFQGNDTRLIIQDVIPFAFFALLLPTHQMLKDKTNHPFLIRLMSVFIFASALFSLITFILFSTGTTILQGPYYKWFRDVVGGKLTDLGSGFWRIVTPEHLLILPITLVIASLLMKKDAINKFLYFPLLACLCILTLNLSRGYFLALVVALFILLYKHTFKKWLTTSALVVASIGILFCGIYFLASGGKSFGLEVFGLRLHSFTAPKIEESTYTRSALLSPILQKFKAHPILGSGLGSTVTFVNPVSQKQITTPQFDWGYLEIATEFGLLGGILYFLLIGYIMYLTVLYIQTTTLHPDFLVGLLGGLGALLVTNLTAPALSHVFGVFYITIVLAIILHSNDVWEKIKLKFTKLFHRFI